MISLFLSLIALQCCLLLWGAVEVKRFLGQHAAIDGPQSLEAFKVMARRNMRVAVFLLAPGIVSLVLAVALVRYHGSVGLLIALAAFAVYGVLAAYLTRFEHRARALKCADASLQQVYQAVGQSWRKKLLPDF